MHCVSMLTFQRGRVTASLRFLSKSWPPRLRPHCHTLTLPPSADAEQRLMEHKENNYNSNNMERIIHQYKKTNLWDWRLLWVSVHRAAFLESNFSKLSGTHNLIISVLFNLITVLPGIHLKKMAIETKNVYRCSLWGNL